MPGGVCESVWKRVAMCASVAAHTHPQAWSERENKLVLGQLESLGVGMNNRSSHSMETGKRAQGSSPQVAAEPFSSHSSTERSAARSPLLYRAANSFQMKGVYLAY